MRSISFYRTASGTCPVETFLDTVRSKDAQKIAWVMRLVESLDRVPSQYFKKLTGTADLWEVRVQSGSLTYRLLGFFDGSVLVLAHGFAKKTDKTPPKEIATAERRQSDHLSRKAKR